MKRFTALLGAVMMFSGLAAFAADPTPVKLSLIPNVGIPESQVVHGVDLGILGSKVQEVQGAQLALFYSATTKKMVGYQSGFVTSATKITGLQSGFVNFADNVTGVNYGFVNKTGYVNGLQLGFVNITDDMKGVQIGLVNVLKKGKLPFMVLVNGKF